MPRKNPGLRAYRAKRAAGATPEPFGAGEPAPEGAPRVFVVQKHAARALHWDLRLEIGGVLRSWAVPRGPSPDPADKRLAMETEDHPLEYARFEGVIPEGNYGAGAMIVWDRGTWIPLEEVEAGLAKGKLLFELRGWKLRGRWTLFRTKQSDRSWMFVKERDAFAAPAGERPFAEDSVLSGLTVEELRDGNPRAEALRAELAAEGLPPAPADLREMSPMLAEVADGPFTRPGWIFELKYDGYRLIAESAAGRARLLYRSGRDVTAAFPEIAGAVAALPWGRAVLDGEMVVLDDEGRPSFQLLQRRVQAPPGREREASLFAFDLLALGEFDLRRLPLLRRKELLRRVLPSHGALRFADHVDAEGEALYRAARDRGLEGIVAKRGGAPYRAGRSDDWLKVRADRVEDFAVVGFKAVRSTGAIGALHLAVHDGSGLVYAGSVGSGLTEADRRTLDAMRESAGAAGAPCRLPQPAPEGTWVEPRLVCEVRFKEWTDEGLLRQPVFLRLRDDKAPEACRGGRASIPPPAPGVAPASRREVPFSRLEKVFWPEEGYTKGDLIGFYREVSLWLLPYLEDRPLVLTRYPDGIAGKHFFQKDAPDFAPEWVRRERMWSEDSEREIDYFVVDGTDALLYLANLATIPLHVWASRTRTLQRPDWCILDLDPKGAPFAHVVKVALALRRLCDEIGLVSRVKTSGSSGLHVLLPLGRQCTFEQARALASVLARVVADELPEIATVERALRQRAGRVYVDALQNGHGKLLVAPFSVRPLPGATVSTPLLWREVNARLDLADHTIRTVPARMARMGDDPLLPVRDEVPDLAGALGRLAERARG